MVYRNTPANPAQLWASRLGRLALGAIFLMSGLGKLANLSETAAYMRSAHMSAVPLFLTGAILLEILGGLSVITGLKARWGAMALIVFLVPATFIFHNFWAYQGMDRQMQMINFLKNVSIGGGLLSLFAMSPSRLPLRTDSRRAPA
jgi:putative oxidoreductase